MSTVHSFLNESLDEYAINLIKLLNLFLII